MHYLNFAEGLQGSRLYLSFIIIIITIITIIIISTTIFYENLVEGLSTKLVQLL